MKKLRLLLSEKCNRSCAGCCNKGFDLANLPVCHDPSGYELVMLTGGEPMLDPEKVIDVANEVPLHNKVVMYTAKCDNTQEFIRVLYYLDGVTLTLHEQEDVEHFVRLVNTMRDEGHYISKNFSKRLNVFKGVKLPEDLDLSDWQVKDNIVWIKDCPLPSDEVFMRYGC